jgi:hypothetical protein
MRRISLAFVLIVSLAGCNGPIAEPARLGAAPPPGRVIGFNPSSVGLPAAVGTTVYDSGGVISWYKYGTSNTAWRPVPVSQLVSADPSVSPGLKAPVGYLVTKNDGSAAWTKIASDDTGWQPVTNGLTLVRSPVFSLLSTGNTNVTMPLLSGKHFVVMTARLSLLTRDSTTVSTGPTLDWKQNGTTIDAFTIPMSAGTFNTNLPLPISFALAVSNTYSEIDTTTYPLQIGVTVAVSGGGITTANAQVEVMGYYQ